MKLKQLKIFLLLSVLIGITNSCSTVQTPNDPYYTVDGMKSQKKGEPKKEGSETVDEPTAQVEIVESKETKTERVTVNLPDVKREFRAAWVATVANINWPSKRNLTTEEQKAEAIYILDVLKENNFNAVIFQVRPSADAMYDSPYEPWSVFLNGTTGMGPVPYYDPLKFWVQEAHKRGLELHVWLNPYRAHHTNGGSVTGESMVYKMPKEIVKLSNGMYWFDPAKKATQDHVSKVVLDIVKRYDIDGVHFDDYFYPYKSYHGGKDFPDKDSWQEYQRNGGGLGRADWRRENVNQFIKRIYSEIKAEKEWVKFGLSPFGIWKSGYPMGVAGMSQYDELYADAKLWLNEGWIDYFAPQLYWSIDAPKQSFPALLKWWKEENYHNRHLWPGLNTVEVRTSRNRVDEISDQVQLTRQILEKDEGVIHWSFGGLTQPMLSRLKSDLYSEKALIPKTPWLKSFNLKRPELYTYDEREVFELDWMVEDLESVSHWILYKRYHDKWETEILPAHEISSVALKVKNGKELNLVAVKAVDRNGYESDYEAIVIK